MEIENNCIYYTEKLMPIQFENIHGNLETYIRIKDMISGKGFDVERIGKVLYKDVENKIKITAPNENLIFDSNFNIILLEQKRNNELHVAIYINNSNMFSNQHIYETSNTVSIYKLKTKVENKYIAHIIPKIDVHDNIFIKLNKLCSKLYGMH